MKEKLRRVLLAAVVIFDRAINVLLGGSSKETLSARAHRMRVKPQPYWFWLADAIDALFFWQPDHCKKQFDFERAQQAARASAEVPSGGRL